MIGCEKTIFCSSIHIYNSFRFQVRLNPFCSSDAYHHGEVRHSRIHVCRSRPTLKRVHSNRTPAVKTPYKVCFGWQNLYADFSGSARPIYMRILDVYLKKIAQKSIVCLFSASRTTTASSSSRVTAFFLLENSFCT